MLIIVIVVNNDDNNNNKYGKKNIKHINLYIPKFIYLLVYMYVPIFMYKVTPAIKYYYNFQSNKISQKHFN